MKKAAESTTKDKLEDKDYEISAKEEYTLTRDGTDFQFKDYAPSVFHKVREVLGVSADEFLVRISAVSQGYGFSVQPLLVFFNW